MTGGVRTAGQIGTNVGPLTTRFQMKHFWLSEAAQALMDSATSNAADYGHIGLFKVDKAWKTHVKNMVGSKVDPANYLRAYNLTNSVSFATERDWLKPREVRALIRLTPQQAMMMKLRHGGSDEAWVRADPTGEFWGNMLIANEDRKRRCGRTMARASWTLLGDYLDGGSFGPTIANVASFADALEPEMRSAFVWYHILDWDKAADPYVEPEDRRSELVKEWQNQRALEEYGPLAWEVDGSAWSAPAPINGTRWAQDFWRLCQSADFRRWNRIMSGAAAGQEDAA